MPARFAKFRATGVKEAASPLSRRDKLAAAILALLFLFLGYYRMVPKVCGVYHDDAIYVITGKALAQGLGYRLINLPHAPLQTKFPILYPALLAVVWKVWPAFPDNLVLMKWLSVLCGAATLGLAYLFLLRFGYFSRGVVSPACLLSATSPIFLYFASNTLSEIPFALLAVVALWVMEAQVRTPTWGPGRQFWSGVLLALPFMCRVLGASLVVAGLFTLYYWRRPLRWVVLGLAAVMLPWFLWTLRGLGAWSRDPILGYYTDYLGWWVSTGPLLLMKVMVGNLLNISIASTVLSLEGVNQALMAAQVAAWPVLGILIGLIPLIAVISQRGKGQILPCFIVLYLAIVLWVPWSPNRYLIPILPFIIAYLFFGIWALLRNLAAKLSVRSLTLAIVAPLILANLLLLHRYHALAQRTGYPFNSLESHPASWSRYQALFNWLNTHTGPQDIIASWKDPMIYLYTGRTAIRPWRMTPALLMGYRNHGNEVHPFGTVDELERTLKAYQVRYLVQVPIYSFDSKVIDKLFEGLQEQRLITPVYVGKDRRFAIFACQPRLDR